MKRITISLPDEMAERLQYQARRLRAPVSEVAREALRSYLSLSNEAPRDIPFANLGSSGCEDTASRIDEILAREWGDGLTRGC